MSLSTGDDANEFPNYSSPPPTEKLLETTRNQNGGSACFSKPSTSRSVYFAFSNSNSVPPSKTKRTTQLVNGARNNLADTKTDGIGSSNEASIFNSGLHFVAAKGKFETDSKELQAKYTFISSKLVSTSTSVGEKTGGISAYPTKSGCSNLLNGNGDSGGVRQPETFSSPTVSKADGISAYPTKTASSKLVNGNGGVGNHCESDTFSSSTVANGGVPPPLFEIYPATGVRLLWDESFRCSANVGLNNLGNTCFLNSVLQVLTHTAPLANYLLKDEHDPQTCPAVSNSFCALCTMRNHINRVLTCAANRHDSCSPTLVVQRIRAFMKSHIVGRQEDAHEFLRYFMDAMQTAALFPFKDQKLDLFTKETSVISRIFGGYHKNEIVCNSCHSSSVTYDPFLDLNVEIKQSTSLENALTHFTCAETLASDNAYLCPKCNRRVSAKKIFTIFQEPNVLTIQLKRFDHNGKIDRSITYPERLNLRPYMTEKHGSPVNYKLYGVIVHVGRTTHSGHYFSFVRNSIDQWYLLDDSRVSQVPVSNVLRTPTAYLLFYTRTRTPIAPVKPQAKPQAGFIGPQRPPCSTTPSSSEATTTPSNGLHNNSWGQKIQINFKSTFSENRSSSPSTAATPVVPNGFARTPTIGPLAKPSNGNQLAPLPNSIRVQPMRWNNPQRYRYYGPNLKNIGPTTPTGREQPISPKPPPVILKLQTPRPIQDCSVSSSTTPKLVPYEEEEEEDEGEVETPTNGGAKIEQNGNTELDGCKPAFVAEDSKLDNVVSENVSNNAAKDATISSTSVTSEASVSLQVNKAEDGSKTKDVILENGNDVGENENFKSLNSPTKTFASLANGDRERGESTESQERTKTDYPKTNGTVDKSDSGKLLDANAKNRLTEVNSSKDGDKAKSIDQKDKYDELSDRNGDDGRSKYVCEKRGHHRYRSMERSAKRHPVKRKTSDDRSYSPQSSFNSERSFDAKRRRRSRSASSEDDRDSVKRHRKRRKSVSKEEKRHRKHGSKHRHKHQRRDRSEERLAEEKEKLKKRKKKKHRKKRMKTSSSSSAETSSSEEWVEKKFVL